MGTEAVGTANLKRWFGLLDVTSCLAFCLASAGFILPPLPFHKCSHESGEIDKARCQIATAARIAVVLRAARKTQGLREFAGHLCPVLGGRPVVPGKPFLFRMAWRRESGQANSAQDGRHCAFRLRDSARPLDCLHRVKGLVDRPKSFEHRFE